MNNNIQSNNALYGTKTAENLMHAFEHEAIGALRSNIYSTMAQSEGDASTRRMLDEMIENSAADGELWLSYLNQLEDTPSNLRYLAEVKKADNMPLYSQMADIADEEGFHEIAEKFRMASAVHDSQSNMLGDRASELDGTMQYPAETVHRCPICGYTVTGNSHPDICPLCVREWK